MHVYLQVPPPVNRLEQQFADTTAHGLRAADDWGASDHADAAADAARAALEEAFYRLEECGGKDGDAASSGQLSAASCASAAAAAAAAAGAGAVGGGSAPGADAPSLADAAQPLTPQQLELKRLLATVVPFDAVHLTPLAARALPRAARAGLGALEDCANVLYQVTATHLRVAQLKFICTFVVCAAACWSVGFKRP